MRAILDARRIVLFAPHPDDIAISMGALAASIAAARTQVTIVLMTDGSEASIPAEITGGGSPEELRARRGQIRVAEAVEEAIRLGFEAGAVRLLHRQTWFTDHRTPRPYLNDDLSLRDVRGFVPGEIEACALDEIAGAVGGGAETVCAVPDPADRLLMHRITHSLVSRVRGQARLLTYECLSTERLTGAQTLFGFGEEQLGVKCHAIRAHVSMRERRLRQGGYSNPGTEFYDVIVTRNNAALAREAGIAFPYAERFGWME